MFAGRADCLVLREGKGIRKIPLMGVIPGFLILVRPLPSHIGIISYLFHFIHGNISISEITHMKLFKKGNSSVMAFIIHISMLLFMYKLNYAGRIY